MTQDEELIVIVAAILLVVSMVSFLQWLDKTFGKRLETWFKRRWP